VPGWLNVDVARSQYDVDLACGRLPWSSDSFDTVVSQHVIEHLELRSELLPLLREVHRVLRPGGELWLSCPDMEKACRSYLENGMADLVADRLSRWPEYALHGAPPSHFLNDLFHQSGEHRNLFDFALLEWALKETGFVGVERAEEAALLARYSDFPARGDDLQSLYVRAVSP
jgi:predicted SAM-dependent methyltransferase